MTSCTRPALADLKTSMAYARAACATIRSGGSQAKRSIHAAALLVPLGAYMSHGHACAVYVCRISCQYTLVLYTNMLCVYRAQFIVYATGRRPFRPGRRLFFFVPDILSTTYGGHYRRGKRPAPLFPGARARLNAHLSQCAHEMGPWQVQLGEAKLRIMDQVGGLLCNTQLSAN